MFMTLPSLSINGMDASENLLAMPDSLDPSTIDPDDPNYEIFDPRLATKVRQLYATLEAETTRVAELRREAPAAAARGFLERLRDEINTDDADWEAARSRAVESVNSGLEEWELPRAYTVQANWTQAINNLEELKGVTETVARLEKAKKAAIEVIGE